MNNDCIFEISLFSNLLNTTKNLAINKTTKKLNTNYFWKILCHKYFPKNYNTKYTTIKKYDKSLKLLIAKNIIPINYINRFIIIEQFDKLKLFHKLILKNMHIINNITRIEKKVDSYMMPQEISLLINLTALHIPNLICIPTEISHLIHLIVLHTNCASLYLPSEIGKLINLKHITINTQSLLYLPFEICNLIESNNLQLGFAYTDDIMFIIQLFLQKIKFKCDKLNDFHKDLEQDVHIFIKKTIIYAQSDDDGNYFGGALLTK